MEELQRIRHYFGEEIWKIDSQSLPPFKRLLLVLGQVGSRVTRDFFADRCMLRASALTYASLLSFVPLLALMFSVLKGFGVQNKLEPLLLEHIAVGSEQVVTKVIEYINNTNVGRLGTFGLVFLIVTVLTLLTNIEDSFNSIWYVRETRSLMRRFSDYFSVVTFAPVFLLAAISMTATLEAQGFVQKLLEMEYVGDLIYFLFKTLPYVAMWVAFAFLYLFMPNTKVRITAALVGGIFGGTMWQFSQWAYVNFQVGVGKYNAIYGTMAALPIFMVWIYVSWVIVLLGLEMTYAVQNLGSLRRDVRGGTINFSSREMVALTLTLVICERFQQGDPPLTQEQISEQLEIPPRLAREILADLVRLQVLSAVVVDGEEEPAYQPARALDTMEVHEVLQALERDGVDFTRLKETPERLAVLNVAETLHRAGGEALSGRTMKDLVSDLQGEVQKERRENAPSSHST
ncbi:MAG: ribonuclease BN-like protein [Desulfuromonas sp.]|nr:MAG: ribonuclease BN-like protein [Desulfuromonas sp.]